MRGKWLMTIVAGAAAMTLAQAAVAGAATNPDPTIIARNILPSGQYGSPAPQASGQAQLYNDLTPLFDNVTAGDLFSKFKSEKLDVDTDGPATQENVPFPGVTLLRDRFNIPHVYANTRDAGIATSGWIAAEDRGLLLEQARYDARTAVIDVPGVTAIGLISGLKSFKPSAQTEAVVSQETNVLLHAGREGRAVLQDMNTFISGINAYLTANKSTNQPWTLNDMYAVNALKAQFLGQGGGDEARRSQFLNGLQQQLGANKGWAAFNDLRQFKNPRSVITVDHKAPYGQIPKKHKGSVVIDHGSFQTTPAVGASLSSRLGSPQDPFNASNELMVNSGRSTTGHPILVGGPQISYFFPGLVYEVDMHAPNLNWRGATSVPFPGYLLIGRTRTFSTTLTSASGDIVDQYAETLCGGSNRMYRYKGRCLPMQVFDAGTLDGQPVKFLTTVHGPVVGYASVRGVPVAISSKRSDRGSEVLDQLFFRRLSSGGVHDPKSFFKAASLTPQTFNSFYIDSKNTAMYTTGRLPIRNPQVDPGLLTKGTGKFEWRGFAKTSAHPQGVNNKRGYMTNWNNGAARDFGAADNEWGRNGSVGRIDLLNYNLARLARNGRWSPEAITSAMNASATQDIRAIDMVPLLAQVLQGSQAPSPLAQQMLNQMVAWRAHGGNRLDINGDDLIDDPGAAVMDGAYPKIVSNELGVIAPLQTELNTLFSRFDAPPSGQYSGWYQYFDRDIRGLLAKKGKKPRDRFRLKYCGGGNKALCQQSIWAAIQAAGETLTQEQGTADPSQWHASASKEAIKFNPLPLITMRYTNRPSGIQQVISFSSGAKKSKGKKKGKGKK